MNPESFREMPRHNQLSLAVAQAFEINRNSIIDSARIALGTNERVGAYMNHLQSHWVRLSVGLADAFEKHNTSKKAGTNGRMSREEINDDIADVFLWHFREGLYGLIEMSGISAAAQKQWVYWVNICCDSIQSTAVEYLLNMCKAQYNTSNPV